MTDAERDRGAMARLRAGAAIAWHASEWFDTRLPRVVAGAMALLGGVPPLRPPALARRARVSSWLPIEQRVGWCDDVLAVRPTYLAAALSRAEVLQATRREEAADTIARAWVLAPEAARPDLLERLDALGAPDAVAGSALRHTLDAIADDIGDAPTVGARSALVAGMVRAGAADVAADRLESLGNPDVNETTLTRLVNALHRQGEITRPLRVASAYRSRLGSAQFDRFIAARQREIEVLEHGIDVEVKTFDYTAGDTIHALYLLHNSLPHQSGGYATRTHGLLQALQHLEHPTVGVTRPGFPAWRGVFEQVDGIAPVDVVDGVTYRRLIGPVDALPRGDLQAFTDMYIGYLRPVMDEYRPRVLHAASNWWNGIAATRAASAAGVPSVYEIRGLWEVTRASRQTAWGSSETYELDARFEVDVARSADRVITITGALKDEMVRRGVAAERITVVPNAVDVDRFSKVERDPELIEQLGFEGSLVIGFAGSLTFYEGLDDLLSACAALRGSTRPFGLLFVGDGAVRAELEEHARSLGIDDICRFVGRVPHHEVERYLGVMDITPFPRKPIPVCEMVSPLKPLESMASGVAVLVSSVDALLEMVDFGRCGLTFEKGDVDDLARQLQRLMEDDDLRAQLVHDARDWVTANRSWLAVARTVADLYDELAPRR